MVHLVCLHPFVHHTHLLYYLPTTSQQAGWSAYELVQHFSRPPVLFSLVLHKVTVSSHSSCLLPVLGHLKPALAAAVLLLLRLCSYDEAAACCCSLLLLLMVQLPLLLLPLHGATY